MSAGELVTRWTIRAALALYVAVLAGHLWLGPLRKLPLAHRWKRIARACWTAGCVLLLAHMAAAFHYYHHWSHHAAALATTEQTKAQVGMAFAGGIYFNYAVAALWLGDVLWWWLAPVSYELRPRWLTLSLHGYLLFIAINGAIVFESGPTRWWGLAVVAALAGLALRRWWIGHTLRESA